MSDNPDTYFKIPLAKNRSEKCPGSESVARTNSAKREPAIRGGFSYSGGGTLSAFESHRKYVKDHLLYYEDGRLPEQLAEWKPNVGPSEIDILKSNHKFIRDGDEFSWEERVAHKYYEGLYKEYCIADLSQYKRGSVALRWRTKTEVISGKGERSCGNIRCKRGKGLRAWEVNFGYIEGGTKKNTLVKVCLCPRCSHKLNYRRNKERSSDDKLPRDELEKGVPESKSNLE